MNHYAFLLSIACYILYLIFSQSVYAKNYSLEKDSLEKNIQEKNVNPGINDYYYDADFEQWRASFEMPGREVFDRQNAILHELEIKPGMAIADIGAGTGLYTIPFAQQVGPEGKVYAVDISASFIKNIKLRAAQNKLNNISGIINNQKSTQLAINSIDMAFICNTYHHFEYPKTTLASIHQALRSDGTMIIIDFRKIVDVSSSWVMRHVRSDKNAVIKEIEANGFRLIDDKEILHSNYYLSFRKIN